MGGKTGIKVRGGCSHMVYRHHRKAKLFADQRTCVCSKQSVVDESAKAERFIQACKSSVASLRSHPIVRKSVAAFATLIEYERQGEATMLVQRPAQKAKHDGIGFLSVCTNHRKANTARCLSELGGAQVGVRLSLQGEWKALV